MSTLADSSLDEYTRDDCDIVRFDLPATHKYLNVLGTCVRQLLERVPDLAEPEIIAYNMELALHEICANIVDHAYSENQAGRIAIELQFNLDAEPRWFRATVRDSGREFHITDASEPDLEHGQVRGYGLFLVQQLVDNASYNREADGNCWTLIKNL